VSGDHFFFFLSFDGGASYEPLAVPVTLQAPYVSPSTLVVAHLLEVRLLAPQRILLLVDTADFREALLTVEVTTGDVSIGEVFVRSSTTAAKAAGSVLRAKATTVTSTTPASALLPIGVSPCLSGSGEVFIYSSSLYYSGDFGRHAHRVTLRSRSPTVTAVELGVGEFVQMWSGSVRGTYVIVTSARRLFYGATGVSHAVELASPVSPNAIIFPSLVAASSYSYAGDAALQVSTSARAVTHAVTHAVLYSFSLFLSFFFSLSLLSLSLSHTHAHKRMYCISGCGVVVWLYRRGVGHRVARRRRKRRSARRRIAASIHGTDDDDDDDDGGIRRCYCRAVDQRTDGAATAGGV
jgi:hypothetical protein